MKPETSEWLETAERDLAVARMVLREEFWRHCIFQCQQALEKMLKALWVEGAAEGYPPREHNLTLLASKAGVDLTDDQRSFFDNLSKQYIPARYPDVEIELGVEYSQQQAENCYQRTVEEFEWLRQQLK